MQMPPSGGLPGPLAQAPANAGAMVSPQGNQGNIGAALVKIKNALKMLEEALPLVPMGDELHTDLLNTMKQLSKPLKKSSDNPQMEVGSLLQMAKQNAQSAPMAAMARMFGAGQAGAGQPPAMSAPAAA